VLFLASFAGAILTDQPPDPTGFRPSRRCSAYWSRSPQTCGPAHELRESLREVLDRFASPEEMENAAVKPERNAKADEIYTMKQKVHFIFKNRERNTTGSAVPENAVNMVEEVVASMTRSTYDRGSLSAHQERGKKACDQLKRYVGVVLHDLLEI
jgi:hypothetical protein